MKTNAGLWIDHRKCILVLIDDRNTEKVTLNSNAEKHTGRIDGKRSTVSFESRMVKADDRQERHFSGQLNTYYDEVISYLGNAESVFVFGPGEAKGELLKRINMHKIKGRLEDVEGADKMTDDQIVAKVKQHYLNK